LFLIYFIVLFIWKHIKLGYLLMSYDYNKIVAHSISLVLNNVVHATLAISAGILTGLAAGKTLRINITDNPNSHLSDINISMRIDTIPMLMSTGIIMGYTLGSGLLIDTYNSICDTVYGYLSHQFPMTEDNPIHLDINNIEPPLIGNIGAEQHYLDHTI
jgi:hypothetical protein